MQRDTPRERVATRVRTKLAELNRTQHWLAAQMGTGPMYLSRRMNGDVAWTVDDLDALRRILGITDLLEDVAA